MSEVIAGAVGGLLALLGALIAQGAAGRRARRDVLRRAAVEVLTQGAVFVDAAVMSRSALKRGTLASPDDDPLEKIHAGYLEAIGRATFELTLVAGRDVTRHAMRAQTLGQRVLFSTVPTLANDTEWREALIEFGAARLELQLAVRRELGGRKLTEDVLGMDPPPSGAQLLDGAHADPS